MVKPMLAYKVQPDEMDQLRFPLLCSPKLDGVRALIQGGKVLSRSLKPIPNKYVQQLFAKPELEGLEGELIVGDRTDPHVCDITRSGVMSRAGEPDVSFNVFDQLPGKVNVMGFDSRLAIAGERVRALHNLGMAAPWSRRVKLVMHTKHFTLNTFEEYEQRLLAAGYEGVMLRDPKGLYKQGRSTLKEHGLLAVKRFVDAEAVVIGTYEQEANFNEAKTSELGKTKRSTHQAGKVGKGTLGGFVCITMEQYKYHTPSTLKGLAQKLEDEGTLVSSHFHIGGGLGLTAALRKELWNKRTTIVGKIVKYKKQLVGEKDAPRSPQFLGFRDPRDM